MSLYDYLDVSAKATTEEIKKAYLRKARQQHPDKHQDDIELANAYMQKLNKAKEILTDPIKRSEYDRRQIEKKQRKEYERKLEEEMKKRTVSSTSNVYPYASYTTKTYYTYNTGYTQYYPSTPHQNEPGLENIFEIITNERGIQFLSDMSYMRAKITAKQFNEIAQNGPFAGTSPLYWFLQTPAGIALLREDRNLRAKITAAGLNAEITRPNVTGDSPFYTLSRSQEGRAFLSEYEDLFALASSEALNRQIKYHLNNGSLDNGNSPIYNIASDKNTIHLIFRDNPSFHKKINQPGLNNCTQSISNQGASTLYRIVSHPKGAEFLWQCDYVRECINHIGLNQKIQSGPEKGHSVISKLLNTDAGRALFTFNYLLNALEPEGVNSLIDTNGAKNPVIIDWLFNTEIGERFLTISPALRWNILKSQEGIYKDINTKTTQNPFYSFTRERKPESNTSEPSTPRTRPGGYAFRA